MSSPETQIQDEQIQPQELTQTQEVKEIMPEQINEIIAHPEKYPTEAKLILILERWNRQGSAYTDYAEFTVIDGEVEEVELEHYCESYPYPCFTKIALIPKTVPVVVKWHSYTDTTDPPQRKLIIYVFTGKEWKRVDLY